MPAKICARELLLIAALLLSSTPAAAWNAAGHRLAAAVAWRQMDAPTRATVGSVLARHPDHAAWLSRNPTLAPAYAAFLEASTWPDDIKRDKRFHDTDEAPTPLLPGFADMGRHRNWHYIDLPVSGNPAREQGSGELDGRLTALLHLLETPDTADSARAIALAWLIHLVADAHQPLHVVSRYDDQGRGDDGGNGLWIENPFHPRRSSTTLHAYWDDLPGPPWLRGEHLETAASSLIGQGSQPAGAGTVHQWIEESLSLARSVAYEGLVGEVPTLDADYHQRAMKTARERVALAGKRLGLLLEKRLAR